MNTAKYRKLRTGTSLEDLHDISFDMKEKGYERLYVNFYILDFKKCDFLSKFTSVTHLMLEGKFITNGFPVLPNVICLTLMRTDLGSLDLKSKFPNLELVFISEVKAPNLSNIVSIKSLKALDLLFVKLDGGWDQLSNLSDSLQWIRIDNCNLQTLPDISCERLVVDGCSKLSSFSFDVCQMSDFFIMGRHRLSVSESIKFVENRLPTKVFFCKGPDLEYFAKVRAAYGDRFIGDFSESSEIFHLRYGVDEKYRLELV